MNRYLVRVAVVAVGFAVGGLIAALGIISSGISPVSQLIRVGAFSISGAIGGASLRKGWRPVIGFGLAFGVFGAVCPIKEMMRGGGWLSPTAIIFIICVGLLVAIPFGLVGAIGMAISYLEWRMVLAGAGAFGGAGFIGGMVMVILNDGLRSGRIDIPRFLVDLVLFLITYALGGALFALASEYPSHKRKKLGLCLKCGYDLQGLPKHGHQCPECGTPFELSVNNPPAVSVGVLNQEINRLNRPQL